MMPWAMGGCGKGVAAATETAPQIAPTAVTTAPVQVQPLQRKVHVVGNLVGLETAALSNRMAGAVTKVLVDLGDRVKPNAELAEVDTERYARVLEQTEQTLQETLAKLGIERLPQKDFDVNNTAPVKKAISTLANAKQKADRAEELHGKGLMSEFEYLDTTSAYRVAQSELETARDEARALVAQAQENAAEVAMRKKDLSDATIYAPDGNTPSGQKIDSYAITGRSISVGEYLKEGMPTFSLVADHVLKLQARVPERYLASVALKQDVAFHVEAYKGVTFHGSVAVIDPSVDQASRTFLVEAYVDNADGKLRAGSFIEGDILIRIEPQIVMVPLDAIISFAGVNKIFVVEGDKAHQLEIHPGQQEGDWIEIDQKLNTSQAVVTSGQSKLFDGAPIRVTHGGSEK
jgi:RND family efflux transporter MFP subunit